MSGTRSTSRKAQAISAPPEALIVAHGQPGDPEPAEAALAELARAVDALMPTTRVRGATLALPGRLEEAAGAASPPVIFPLFMADGWFTQTELPRRLGTAGGAILDPLGLDPELANIAQRMLRRAAGEQGLDPERLDVLIAAHGSPGNPRPAAVCRDFAAGLKALLPEATLRIGFIDESPSVQAAATGLPPETICLPFFAAQGNHVRQDLPQELAAAGFAGTVLPPIGCHPDIPALIARRISHA